MALSPFHFASHSRAAYLENPVLRPQRSPEDNEQIGWGGWPPSHACAGCSPCSILGRTPLSKAFRNADFGCYFTAPRAISRQSCPTVEQIVLQATSVLKLHCICRLLVPRAATRFGLGECDWTCACKGSTRAKVRPWRLSVGGAVCRTSAFRTIGASVSHVRMQHVVVLWVVELRASVAAPDLIT